MKQRNGMLVHDTWRQEPARCLGKPDLGRIPAAAKTNDRRSTRPEVAKAQREHNDAQLQGDFIWNSSFRLSPCPQP